MTLISGGKDSCYSMMKCVAAGHQLVALANLQPAERVDELDSYMFQTVGHDGIHLYAEAMGIPLYQVTTEGVSITKEMTYDPKEGDEVEDLYELLRKVKQEVEGGVEGVASGAILSDYQRLRVENVCGRLGLTSLAYLWRRDQGELLKEMIEAKVQAVVIKVAAMGLTPELHLGLSIEELYPELCSLNQKYGLNICGEGGEYETFTLDCPLFKKKIILEKSEVVVHSNDEFAPVAFLKLSRLKLQEKDSTCLAVESNLSPRSCVDSILSPRSCVDSVLSPRFPCSLRVSPTPGGSTWVASSGDPTYPSVLGQTEHLLEAIGSSLETCGLEWGAVVLVYLYLSDMAHYAVINQLYAKYFAVKPPARVCVCASLPEEEVHLRLEMLVCTNQEREEREEGVVSGRSSMHVQSLSEWAPANIGPYSQAYTVNGVVFGAGQIGLVPTHMVLAPPLAQGALALHHVQSVFRACKTSLTSALCGVCYYTTEQAGWCARMALRECEASSHVGERVECPIGFARVLSLPKGACVEWHFTACVSALPITYSTLHLHTESVGVLTLQESWCSELGAGSWLATTTRPSASNDLPRDLCLHLATCFQSINKQLTKHELSLSQITMAHVFLPRNGVGKLLKAGDVQGIAESVTGCNSSVPLSLLWTEDWWEQNGSISVHALMVASLYNKQSF